MVRLKVEFAQFRSVEGLQEIGWAVQGDETVAPTFTVSNWRGKPVLLEGKRYNEWKQDHGAAFNWTITSLPLRAAVRTQAGAPPVACGAVPGQAGQR